MLKYTVPAFAALAIVASSNLYAMVKQTTGMTSMPITVLARNGADNAAGDKGGKGRKGGGEGAGHPYSPETAKPVVELARNGADDPKGDDRGGRGGRGRGGKDDSKPHG